MTLENSGKQPVIVRVKIKTTDGEIIIWANKVESGERVFYTRLNKQGESVPHNTMRVVICTKEDVVWEKPAQMNKKYAELEA